MKKSNFEEIPAIRYPRTQQRDMIPEKAHIPCTFRPNATTSTCATSCLPSAIVWLMIDNESDDDPADSNIITFSEKRSVDIYLPEEAIRCQLYTKINQFTRLLTVLTRRIFLYLKR